MAPLGPESPKEPQISDPATKQIKNLDSHCSVLFSQRRKGEEDALAKSSIQSHINVHHFVADSVVQYFSHILSV